MRVIRAWSRNLTSPLDLIRRHQDDAPVVLLLVAGIVGVYSQTTLPARHGGEMWNLAWNLADHNAFANPFSVLNTGPTASNPPLAPFLTAVLIRVLRAPFLIYMASTLLSILANACSAALLPRLSRIFFGDSMPGIIGAILWLFTMQVIPGWDTNYTAVGLIYFACFTSSIFGPSEHFSKGKSVVAGMLGGALCLLNPSSLLIWATWLVFLSWRAGIRNRNVVASFGTIFAVAFLALSGWALRNEFTIGAFVVRTGLGIELYVSDNDCAQPTILQENLSGCFQSHHPNSSLSEAQQYRELGEVQYNAARVGDTKAWIRGHFSAFVRLSALRFVAFWFPVAETIPDGFAFPENFGIPDYMARWKRWEHGVAYAIWICTVLSIFGLGIMIFERQQAVWFVVASLGVYPLMYYITIADVRYRDPVLWISVLPAGYFLTWIIDRLFTRAKGRMAAPEIG